MEENRVVVTLPRPSAVLRCADRRRRGGVRPFDDAATGAARVSGVAPAAGRGAAPGSAVLALRIGAALLQAVALYALVAAALPPSQWPASHPGLFLPLVLIATGVPLLVVAGAGRLPVRALGLWAAVAAMALFGFGWWDVARRPPGPADGMDALIPWPPLIPALLAGFFVANVLLTDCVQERRLLTPYGRHIDTAWKQTLQAALAAAFTGLLWGVLALGAGLFGILGIDLFSPVLAQPWFALPTTAVAFAIAVHVTDVQPGLIRGARIVLLLLLSWLLPLLAFILLAFLLALPFTTLQPLWQTHFAAALLLSTAGVVVVLVNAAYAEGADWRGSRVKRLAASVASLELPLLLGLAAAALWQRVAQYGWSVDRIFAAAGLVLLACYAGGYVAAALGRRWALLERTNLVAACIGLLLILLLFSPVADPARLMVADQLGRLHAGRIAPAAFDFATLGSDGARWGAKAVEQLHSDPDAAIAAAARAADGPATAGPPAVLEPDQLAGRVTVLPAGHALPAALLHARFGTDADDIPFCFLPGSATCTVRFLALVPGNPDAALVVYGFTADILEQVAPERWEKTGTLAGPAGCPATQAALGAPGLELVPHPAQDIVAGGWRLTVTPLPQPCPPEDAK